VTTIRVEGFAAIDIHVDSAGAFNAVFNDQEYSAKTMAELHDKLNKAVKKARDQGVVDVTVVGIVPIVRKVGAYHHPGDHFMQGPGVVNAKLRGKHDRQSNCYLLMTEAGDGVKAGLKFQIGYSREGRICRRLTLAEATRYVELAKARDAAIEALNDYEQGILLDVDDALAKARKKPEQKGA